MGYPFWASLRAVDLTFAGEAINSSKTIPPKGYEDRRGQLCAAAWAAAAAISLAKEPLRIISRRSSSPR